MVYIRRKIVYLQPVNNQYELYQLTFCHKKTKKIWLSQTTRWQNHTKSKWLSR